MVARAFTEEQSRKIRSDYETGFGLMRLAKKWGRSHVAIRSAIKRAGGVIRSENGFGIHALTPDQEQYVAAQYAGGRSSPSLAEEFGVDTDTIIRVVRATGGQVRTHREAVALTSYRVHELDRNYFQEIDTPEKARWLGFIAADGCILQQRKALVLRVALAVKDSSHVDALKHSLSYSGPIYVSQSKDQRGKTFEKATLAVCCTDLCHDLARHGVEPRKSFTLPAWNGSRNLMRHWFAGMVDGDGYLFRVKANNWRLGLCGTEAVTTAFSRFVEEETGHAPSVSANGNIFKCHTDRLYVIQAMLPLLYCNLEGSIPLERKHLMAMECLACKPIGRPYRLKANARRTPAALVQRTLFD